MTGCSPNSRGISTTSDFHFLSSVDKLSLTIANIVISSFLCIEFIGEIKKVVPATAHESEALEARERNTSFGEEMISIPIYSS